MPASPTAPPAGLSRRALLGGAAALPGLAALTPTAASAAANEVVLWGSSSAASWRADEPAGFRTVRVHEELGRLLGLVGVTWGLPAALSTESMMARSEAYGINLDFSYVGAGGMLPGSGDRILATTDRRAPTTGLRLPGTIDGVPFEARAVVGRLRKVRIRRATPGAAAPVRDPRWRTSLEARHRGALQILWIGKNNIRDTATVIRDIDAAYALEPSRSMVVGHWKTWWDRPGTEQGQAVDTVNHRNLDRYGSRYFSTNLALRSSRWWNLPELKGLGIGTSAVDRERLDMGLPPRSLIGSDGVHLNSYGYLIVAHALAEQIRSVGLA